MASCPNCGEKVDLWKVIDEREPYYCPKCHCLLGTSWRRRTIVPIALLVVLVTALDVFTGKLYISIPAAIIGIVIALRYIWEPQLLAIPESSDGDQAS